MSSNFNNYSILTSPHNYLGGGGEGGGGMEYIDLQCCN